MEVKINSELITNNVDVLIESTHKFEKELSGLRGDQRAVVVKEVNEYIRQLPGHSSNIVENPYPPHLPNDYESSLCVLKIPGDIRVVLSTDDDPIFERIIVTLFRIVNHNNLDEVYKATAESLYQELFSAKREPAHII